jgi:hypothetical protein
VDIGKLTFLVMTAFGATACASAALQQQFIHVVERVCPGAHEVENAGSFSVKVVAGSVRVTTPGGDARGLSSVLVNLTPLQPPSGSLEFHELTREDGSFVFRDVPEGSYVITVCRDGFVTLQATLKVSGRESAKPIVLSTRLDW